MSAISQLSKNFLDKTQKLYQKIEQKGCFFFFLEHVILPEGKKQLAVIKLDFPFNRCLQHALLIAAIS